MKNKKKGEEKVHQISEEECSDSTLHNIPILNIKCDTVSYY